MTKHATDAAFVESVLANAREKQAARQREKYRTHYTDATPDMHRCLYDSNGRLYEYQFFVCGDCGWWKSNRLSEGRRGGSRTSSAVLLCRCDLEME